MFFRSRLGADSCGQQRISVRMIEQLCTKCQLFVLRCAKKGAPSSCALFFGEEYRCISRQDGIIAHGALWRRRSGGELLPSVLCHNRSSESCRNRWCGRADGQIDSFDSIQLIRLIDDDSFNCQIYQLVGIPTRLAMPLPLDLPI